MEQRAGWGRSTQLRSVCATLFTHLIHSLRAVYNKVWAPSEGTTLPMVAPFEWQADAMEVRCAPELRASVPGAIAGSGFKLATASRLKMTVAETIVYMSKMTDATTTGLTDAVALASAYCTPDGSLVNKDWAGLLVDWKTPAAMQDAHAITTLAYQHVMGAVELFKRPVPVVFTDFATTIRVWSLEGRAIGEFVGADGSSLALPAAMLLVRDLLALQLAEMERKLRVRALMQVRLSSGARRRRVCSPLTMQCLLPPTSPPRSRRRWRWRHRCCAPTTTATMAAATIAAPALAAVAAVTLISCRRRHEVTQADGAAAVGAVLRVVGAPLGAPLGALPAVQTGPVARGEVSAGFVPVRGQQAPALRQHWGACGLPLCATALTRRSNRPTRTPLH